MIKYKAYSSQIGESGDYDSSLVIWHNNKRIGYATEGNYLEISGDFRSSIETETIDDDGIPMMIDKTFELNIQDLIALQRILLWWVYDDEEPIDLIYK